MAAPPAEAGGSDLGSTTRLSPVRASVRQQSALGSAKVRCFYDMQPCEPQKTSVTRALTDASHGVSGPCVPFVDTKLLLAASRRW